MIKKILKNLFILQVVSNTERRKKGLKTLGNGFSDSIRLNPYNPLSYIIFLILVIWAIVMYGLVGLYKDLKNPFKWD